MRFRHALFASAAMLLGAAACSSSDGDTGAGGEGGAGGGGAGGQIPSQQATSPEQCAFLGGGGTDYIYCDYVSATFSAPLAVADLALEVTTDLGDTLTLEGNPEAEPRLELDLDPGGTMANGFAIVRGATQPHYSPASVNVTVLVAEQIVADTTLTPGYSCVELTSDDWCWMGASETVEIAE